MPPFKIFKVGVDGVKYPVEIVATLEIAKARVQELSEQWPGEYVIADQQGTVHEGPRN